MGQDAPLAVARCHAAGSLIRQEKGSSWHPPLREFVNEQPALAARLGGEHRRVPPHFLPSVADSAGFLYGLSLLLLVCSYKVIIPA